LLGDVRELNHVLHEEVETTLTEVSKPFGRGSCATMAAVIIGIDPEARFLQNRDQFGISSAVLPEAVGDLHYAARRAPALPAGACDL